MPPAIDGPSNLDLEVMAFPTEHSQIESVFACLTVCCDERGQPAADEHTVAAYAIKRTLSFRLRWDVIHLRDIGSTKLTNVVPVKIGITNGKAKPNAFIQLQMQEVD